MAKTIRETIPDTVTDDPILCQLVADELNVDVRYVTRILSGQSSLNRDAIPVGHPLEQYIIPLMERVRITKNYRKHARKRYTILFWEQEGLCNYCQRKFGDNCIATVDHKTPLCRRGDSSPKNLQLLCEKCNLEKGFRTDYEFRSDKEAEWKEQNYKALAKEAVRQDFGITTI